MRMLPHIVLSFFLLVCAIPAHALDVQVSVSSQKMDFGLPYAPENLLDNDPSTAWVGGGVSGGAGQWIELEFDIPVRVYRIGIFNGHQGEGQFEKFRRIRSGRIIYPTGEETRFWLRDEPGEQVVQCLPLASKKLKILVDEVFPKAGPVAEMKLAVSEIKLSITLNALPEGFVPDDLPESVSIPASPDGSDKAVPEEMQSLLRRFYVLQATMSQEYPSLFAPHVRDRFDFQYEVFKEMQRQRGTYAAFRNAAVDPDGLAYEMIYFDKDIAEVRVFGSYTITIGGQDHLLQDDSIFVLMLGDEGWQILELDGQEDGF